LLSESSIQPPRFEQKAGSSVALWNQRDRVETVYVVTRRIPVNKGYRRCGRCRHNRRRELLPRQGSLRLPPRVRCPVDLLAIHPHVHGAGDPVDAMWIVDIAHIEGQNVSGTRRGGHSLCDTRRGVAGAGQVQKLSPCFRRKAESLLRVHSAHNGHVPGVSDHFPVRKRLSSGEEPKAAGRYDRPLETAVLDKVGLSEYCSNGTQDHSDEARSHHSFDNQSVHAVPFPSLGFANRMDIEFARSLWFVRQAAAFFVLVMLASRHISWLVSIGYGLGFATDRSDERVRGSSRGKTRNFRVALTFVLRALSCE